MRPRWASTLVLVCLVGDGCGGGSPSVLIRTNGAPPGVSPTHWAWAPCDGPYRQRCAQAFELLKHVPSEDGGYVHENAMEAAWATLTEAERDIIGARREGFFGFGDINVQLNPAERIWLADVMYDETLVLERWKGCNSLLSELADKAAWVDPWARNEERQAFVRRQCARVTVPRCVAEGPDLDVPDVTWEEISLHPVDFHALRVRLPGWFQPEYEAGIPLWPSADRRHVGYRPRHSYEEPALSLSDYAGPDDRLLSCAATPVFVEGRFTVNDTSESLLRAGSLSKWRVVSAPEHPVRISRPPLPLQPDSDMVRIPAGTLRAGWVTAESPEVFVEAFDIDREEVAYWPLQHLFDERKAWVHTRVRYFNELFGPDPRNQPIVCVDVRFAQQICRLLGKRLPTEAEWTRAAAEWIQTDRATPREGSSSRTPAPCPNRGIVPAPAWAGDEIAPLATDKTVNGVLNLQGNVAEWTSSPFCPPSEDCPGRWVAVRGGYTGAESATRRASGVDLSSVVGFRCVR